MTSYSITLAFHIIFFVAWFAGLFYWGRILIYQRETWEKSLSEANQILLRKQYQTMSKRVYKIIVFPAMIITWVLGLFLMFKIQAWQYSWFQLKLILVLFLTLYQFVGKYFMNQLAKTNKDSIKNLTIPSAISLRIFNEMATWFLGAIVFTVILKDFFLIIITLGLFSLLLFIGFSLFFLKKLKN
jgi:putative membrane protein